MAYTNPTPFIAQLKLQLAASAAWIAAGGVDAAIHYPDADASDSGFPCALLIEENIAYTKLLYGMAPVPNGDLMILIYDKTSVGQLEKLARDIADEICIDLGLAALSVTSITPSTIPDAAEHADGTALIYQCAIALTFGLDL